MTPNLVDARGVDTTAAAGNRNAINPESAAASVQIRSIVGGLVGNMIEWYDFLAYSIFSIYFAKSFFPSDKPTVQLMNTAAIAAVGYLARPLGSWLLTTAILGGTTEFVALRFKASGHEQYFYWYVTAWAALSLLVYIRMPETPCRKIAAIDRARASR